MVSSQGREECLAAKAIVGACRQRARYLEDKNSHVAP
jgi:hypothetical protein